MPQGKLKVKAQLPAAAKKKAGRPKKAGRVSKGKSKKGGKGAKGHLKKVQLALEKAIREDIESSTRAQATSADGRSMSTGSASTSKGAKGKKN